MSNTNENTTINNATPTVDPSMVQAILNDPAIKAMIAGAFAGAAPAAAPAPAPAGVASSFVTKEDLEKILKQSNKKSSKKKDDDEDFDDEDFDEEDLEDDKIDWGTFAGGVAVGVGLAAGGYAAYRLIVD